MTTNLIYLNSNGESTLNVTLLGGNGVVQHVYDADRNPVTPGPGHSFKDAAVSTAVSYYRDGNLAQIITRSADGSKVEVNFADVPAGDPVQTYGPNNEYTVGPLASVREFSATKRAQETWEYQGENGMLTGYSLLSTDSLHPLKLTMAADPSQPGGDAPKLLATLTYHDQNGTHTLTAGADSGNFDAAYWISKNAAELISQDGAGLISQDGAGLISQDGAGIISQDGAGLHAYSVISNDGSSFNTGVIPISSLISSTASGMMFDVSKILINGSNAASLFPTSGTAVFEDGKLTGTGNQFANDNLERALDGLGGPGIGRQYAETSTSDPVDPLTDGIDDATPLNIGSVSGALEGSNRSDWYEVSLVAGHTYVFDMKGASSTGSADSLADPLLRLFDANHVLVKSADEGGTGHDSKLVYQATASGTFYVSARSYNDTGDGNYELDFSEGSKAPQIQSNGGGDSATIYMKEHVNSGDSDTVTIVSGWDLIDGNTLKYSMTGEDVAQFDLNPNGYLVFHATPDFETPRDANHDNVYHVTVTAEDSEGNTDSQDLTINVLDVAERPPGVSQYVFTAKGADITWAQAKSEAEAMGGQLASIAGEHQVDEQDYLRAILAANPDLFVSHSSLNEKFGPWIGLTQPEGSPETGGGWTWLSGETFDPFGWYSPTQPDNFGGSENRGHFFIGNSGAIGWNDFPDTVPPSGYPALQSFITELNVATANLKGTDARDLIYAADINNTIDAAEGDDYVNAGGGDDTVSGAAGDDVIDGGGGNDALDGGDGNDTLRAGDGDDALSGGVGDDVLDSGRGGAIIEGGVGVDQWKADLSLLGSGVALQFSDPSETETMEDVLTVKEIERFDLVTTDQADSIALGTGFAAYSQALSMGFGSDLVLISGGVTAATSGTNAIQMGMGDTDVLLADYSAAATAIIFAVKSNAGVSNGLATDYYSDGDNGVQYGGTGRLQFSGVERFLVSTGSRNDKIVTGDGDDVLNGRLGSDILHGGNGKDNFVFDTKLSSKKSNANSPSQNVDTITDFDHQFDTIYLENKVFKDLVEGHLPKSGFRLISSATSTTRVDPNDRILYDKDDGDLYFDRDGSKGQFERVLFAHVTDGTVLNQTDFEIV